MAIGISLHVVGLTTRLFRMDSTWCAYGGARLRILQEW
jgi:hypothetical protein